MKTKEHIIFSTDKQIRHDSELAAVKNPQETGEWLLAMLCVALEKNKGNDEYIEFVKRESWESE